MKCPFYNNGWCEYALDDEEMSCQPDLWDCRSEGDTETCRFGFNLEDGEE